METWASANRVSVGNLLSGKTEDFLREVGYRCVVVAVVWPVIVLLCSYCFFSICCVLMYNTFTVGLRTVLLALSVPWND